MILYKRPQISTGRRCCFIPQTVVEGSNGHLNVPHRTNTKIKPKTRKAACIALAAKMVYSWEDKEEICYRMYIEEKKSLEEIMDYFKAELKFGPS